MNVSDDPLPRIVEFAAAAVTLVGVVLLSGYLQVLGDAQLLVGLCLAYGGLYATSDDLVTPLIFLSGLCGLVLLLVLYAFDPSWVSLLGAIGLLATGGTGDLWRDGDGAWPTDVLAAMDSARD